MRGPPFGGPASSLVLAHRERFYAIDGPAGGLNLIAYVEQTVGYGF